MNTAENREDLIAILKDLIHINTNRIEEYKKGIEQAKDHTPLRSICEDALESGDKIVGELLQYMIATGAQQDNEQGEIFRGWANIRKTIAPKEKSTLLDNCEFAEEASIKAYELALRSGLHPSSEVFITITRHKSQIEKCHQRLKKLSSKLNKIDL